MPDPMQGSDPPVDGAAVSEGADSLHALAPSACLTDLDGHFFALPILLMITFRLRWQCCASTDYHAGSSLNFEHGREEEGRSRSASDFSDQSEWDHSQAATNFSELITGGEGLALSSCFPIAIFWVDDCFIEQL